MKSSKYFPVQTNDYTTIKSLNIRMNFGWAGYGIFFAIIQKLASVPTRRLELSKITEIAFDLHSTPAEIQPIIDAYFTKADEMFFSSDELNQWLKYFDEKYNKCSEAGKKSASMLSPEELSERARKAGKKSGEQRSTNILVRNELTVSSNEQRSFVDSTNNKIKENRIKENGTKEKETEKNQSKENQKEADPSGLGLDRDSISSSGSSDNTKAVKTNHVTYKTEDIPEVSLYDNSNNITSKVEDVPEVSSYDNTTAITFNHYQELFPLSRSQKFFKMNHESRLLPNRGGIDKANCINYLQIKTSAYNFHSLLETENLQQETIDDLKKFFYQTQPIDVLLPTPDGNPIIADHNKIEINNENPSIVTNESEIIDDFSDLPF